MDGVQIVLSFVVILLGCILVVKNPFYKRNLGLLGMTNAEALELYYSEKSEIEKKQDVKDGCLLLVMLVVMAAFTLGEAIVIINSLSMPMVASSLKLLMLVTAVVNVGYMVIVGYQIFEYVGNIKETEAKLRAKDPNDLYIKTPIWLSKLIWALAFLFSMTPKLYFLYLLWLNLPK